jgi:uncharacterized repeat protein (TIGR01451 family)/uncharacterized protein (TIGR03382 family)
MPSRSKAVNSAAVLRCEFSVPDHAPAQCWNRQIGGALVRRSLSISQIVVAAIGLFAALAATPAFAQVPPPTVLRVSVARQASQLMATADGGTLDLVTYGTTANYTVTITNVGISRAQAVSLTGAAPPGATATRITAVTGASCTISTDGSTFTCANLGDLPDGILADGGLLPATTTTSTITVSLAAVPRPYTTNCTLPDGGPVDGNSLGPVSVTASAINAPPVPASSGVTTTRPLADLAVSATGPDTASESSVVSYQVHAQNNGPCTASRPRLTNGNVSAGLISTGTACTGGYPCTIANSWPAGASVDVTSSYQVDFLPVAIKQSQELQQFDLASTALGAVFATPDPVPANNTAALSTSVSHDTGCSSVGAGSLGFVGLALAAMGLIRRRRRG